MFWLLITLYLKSLEPVDVNLYNYSFEISIGIGVMSFIMLTTILGVFTFINQTRQLFISVILII